MNNHNYNAASMEVGFQQEDTLLTIVAQQINQGLQKLHREDPEQRPMHVRPYSETPNRLYMELLFGKNAEEVANPMLMMREGLFYNDDSIEQELLTTKTHVELYYAKNADGRIGREIIRLASRGQKVKFHTCHPCGWATEPTEYYQMLTRTFPNNYPDKMKRLRKVTLNRVKFSFYLEFTQR